MGCSIKSFLEKSYLDELAAPIKGVSQDISYGLSHKRKVDGFNSIVDSS
jgi:hypothetical protein